MGWGVKGQVSKGRSCIPPGLWYERRGFGGAKTHLFEEGAGRVPYHEPLPDSHPRCLGFGASWRWWFRLCLLLFLVGAPQVNHVTSRDPVMQKMAGSLGIDK